ncbi:MAG: hypothetical protein HC849_27180 [Oscillatoriales cyanobacterium RU_3_3]|nr:hypothetical protein [Microcoleus sp. SU_5_6]NJM63030.1 hypothetical protein [Oscillatoriales cyanobacterium RU_3_3]
MFPFTPHTTLRPDYCSGGSFFGAGAPLCLQDTELRPIAPDCRSILPPCFCQLSTVNCQLPSAF